jgi:hypothetical protein
MDLTSSADTDVRIGSRPRLLRYFREFLPGTPPFRTVGRCFHLTTVRTATGVSSQPGRDRLCRSPSAGAHDLAPRADPLPIEGPRAPASLRFVIILPLAVRASRICLVQQARRTTSYSRSDEPRTVVADRPRLARVRHHRLAGDPGLVGRTADPPLADTATVRPSLISNSPVSNERRGPSDCYLVTDAAIFLRLGVWSDLRRTSSGVGTVCGVHCL